jgi:hypothetical protein
MKFPVRLLQLEKDQVGKCNFTVKFRGFLFSYSSNALEGTFEILQV